MEQEDERNFGEVPYRLQLPTAQQVATALAILALTSPAAMGGIPVLPVTIEDERRRHQDEIVQVMESSVGVHQTSQEAEASLNVSQHRLADATKEVDDLTTHDVSEEDVIHAATRVFEGEVERDKSERFRFAFSRVINDTVDLCILRDNEQYDDSLW